jgi:predicted RNA-binding protein with PUA-like domain
VNYWIYKSEPEVYGIDHLLRDQTTLWDGVRNYMARNNLTAAEVGDRAFFHHSGAKPPGVAGLMEMIETNVVDPTQFDPSSRYFDPTSKPDQPRWMTVRVRFVEKFPNFIPLDALRASFSPEELPMLRKGNRISVTPVPEEVAERILAMGRAGLSIPIAR